MGFDKSANTRCCALVLPFVREASQKVESRAAGASDSNSVNIGFHMMYHVVVEIKFLEITRGIQVESFFQAYFGPISD